VPPRAFLDLQLCLDAPPGTYSIVRQPELICPGTAGSALFIVGPRLSDAIGGSITLAADSGTCATGSFQLDFGDGSQHLSGTFAATTECP
jgi:hypothetical protein